MASQAEQENLAVLVTAADQLAQGNILGAILAPIALQLDRIFGGGPRTGTLAIVRPEAAPLEIPFRNAIRSTGLDQVLGQAWMARELKANPRALTSQRALNSTIAWIILNMLYEGPISLLEDVIAFAQTGQILQDPTAIAADLEVVPGIPGLDPISPLLPPLPTEGMMPNEVDAKFMPGMDRELNAQVNPPSINRGITPTIDLSRWLVPEEINGEGVQFKDEITVGPSTVTLLRIPAKKGKIIGIYNTNVLVNTGSAINARNFTLIAGTVAEGGTGDTSGVYIRQHGAMRSKGNVGISQNPDRMFQRSFGSYVVGPQQDYVIGIQSEVAAAQYFESVQVMGYYFDLGMWPIGK